ncbi:MAG: PLP-dependent aminotransferase family protein [Hyphomicrobiales bacterium]
MSPSPDTALLDVTIDVSGNTPAYQQIYEQIRRLILVGRLAPGLRLPSSRAFAEVLGLSRTTLVSAYDHLQAEGYIEPRRGAGFFVTNYAPEQLLAVSSVSTDKPVSAVPEKPKKAPPPFTPREAESAYFPTEFWARLLQQQWRRHGPQLIETGTGEGFYPLRRAIAEHLRHWRGITCDAEQVFITSGSVEALELLLAVTTKPKEKVWLENPGFSKLCRAVRASELEPVFLPVDSEGVMIDEGLARAPDARIALITAARQYPLGMPLALTRRLALLDWARRAQGWIIEDDYDSEYRYGGKPLPALMSLDETARVIYLGSFSKTMFKGLRLGFVVVPRSLAGPLRKVISQDGTAASAIAQPALAALVENGHYAKHLRRMRRLYARRRASLLEALEKHCGGLLTADNNPSGMHVIAEFTPALRERISDIDAAAHLVAAGLGPYPLSTYYVETPAKQGLLLGFSGASEGDLQAAVLTLSKVLQARVLTAR